MDGTPAYLYLYLYLCGDLQIPRWDITQMGKCTSLMAARKLVSDLRK